MGSRRLERLEGPVAVCTVTYGSRASFLARVLEAANAQTTVDYVQSVVICDNGSSTATKAFLRETRKADSRLRVITLPTNRGSAVAFGEAVRIAAFMASFVWCLDDDNLPDPTALEKLIEEHAVLPKPHALLSLRVDREEYVALSYTAALQQLTGRPGSVLRFDVIDYVRQAFRGGAAGRSDAVRLATAPIRVPYGPYGGLFFESQALRTTGLPRAEF